MRRLLLPGLLALYSFSAAGPGTAEAPEAAGTAGPVGTAEAAEAAEALFDLQIGDAEVDFYLAGSWNASLFGSLGFLVDPAGALSVQTFPGWESALVFRQVPDLTFSVWLRQRYFLEASVVGDFLAEDYDYFDRNYILAGYRGGEGEFLRQLLLGNRDIGIVAYPFIEVPAAGGSSLGVSAQLGAGRSSHELLLRFDNNEQDGIVFIGQNRVSEQTIALDAYQRGRFFRLPDSGVTGLAVFLEDPDGAYAGDDGRRYRRVTAEDGAVDAASGTVTLADPAEGVVLVYYAGIGVAGGIGGLPGESGGLIDPTTTGDFSWAASFLGQAMSERQVTLTGVGDCLRLFEPGEFSPFEILGAYALERAVPEELSRLRVSVARKGAAAVQAADPPSPRLTPGADYLAFEYAGGATRYRREAYPFLDSFDAGPELDPENRLYGPEADAPAGYLDFEIVVSHLTPVSAYLIGADIVPGSVRVLRNGLAETRFEVDYGQGLLTFSTEIAESDRLEVRFRRQLSLAGNGDLLFAWGSTLTPSDALTVQLSAGLRWNLLPGTFTEEAFTRTGSVVLSAGARGRVGPLSYDGSAAVSLSNPDTTGRLRLLGMEATSLAVALSEDTAWPAAAPDDDAPFGGTLDDGNRGLLLYKDYRSYGLLGNSSLMPYTWTPPAEQVFDYATGSKPGPYAVGGSADGDNSGRSLALDLELDSGEWVGAQLPLTADGRLSDLSSARGVVLRYRMVDYAGAGQLALHVQLGEIGEDLDGDLSLDAEASASAAGFSFDDSFNAAALRVGSGPRNTGNSRRDSEDVDGSGILTGDGEGWIVTLADAALIDADTGWVVVRHTFSAAERASLRRARSLRLLVAETGGASASGRLLVDHVGLEASPFSASATAGAVSVSAREAEEQFLPDAPARSLEQAHPEVAEVFHPFGERQKVLAVEWDGGLGSGEWEVKGYVASPSEGIDYREIVYYYHKATADGTALSFALEDGEGGTVEWSLPVAATTGWAEVRVSLDDGRVYRDGVDVGGVSGTLSALRGASVALFRAALTGADQGSLYLDELHLADPRSALGGGAVIAGQLSLPGELLAVRGHTLLRDLSLREELAASSAGFSSLYGNPAAESGFSSRTELGLGISRVDVRADLVARVAEGELDVGGGHSLSLPLAALRLSDSFRLESRQAGPELSRADTLSLRLSRLSLDLESSALGLDETLAQRWLGRLALTPGPAVLDTRLELSEAAEGFTLPSPERGYLANWLGAYSLIAPWRQGATLERQGRLSLDWSLATAPVGLRAAGAYGFHSFDLREAGPQRSLRGSLSLDLSAPISWSEGPLAGLSLSPGYRRSLAVRGSAPGAGEFLGDLDTSWGWLSEQAYAFAGLPFAELYGGATAEAFGERTLSLSEATYQAEGYLRLSRRASSRLVDLLVPSSLEAGLGRILERAGDLTSDAALYAASARCLALNLFGRFGAYPLFALYRTDEFSSYFRLLVRDRQAGVGEGELLLEQSASFEGSGGSRLTVRHRLSGQYEAAWSIDDTLELAYGWERHPPQGVRLPLLPADLGRQGYWTHLESAALEAENAGGEDSYHPVNVVLTHESALVLPEHGMLKGVLGAGFDLERAEGEQLYRRFGIRGGLELRLEF